MEPIKDLTLGQKIRKFRERSGRRQLDIETEVGIAPGSLSRIESGKVNPTKETIYKIINTLELKGMEIASIFNMDVQSSIIKSVKQLSKDLNINEVLQNSVNLIAYELKLLAAAVFLVEDDKLYSKTWFTEAIYNLIPDFSKLSIDINSNSKNIILKTIKENKSFYCTNFRDATIDVMDSNTSNVFSKLINFKSGMTYPLVAEDGQVIGAMFYVKNYLDDYNLENDILSDFTDLIAAHIVNSQKVEQLKSQLEKFKMKQYE